MRRSDSHRPLQSRLSLSLLSLSVLFCVCAAQKRASPPPPPSYCSSEPECCGPQSNLAMYSSDFAGQCQGDDTGTCGTPCPTVSDTMCNCSTTVWRSGQYQLLLPIGLNYPPLYSDSRPYSRGVMARGDCCKLCSNTNLDPTGATKPFLCNYWQHYVPAKALTASGCLNSSDCGYCILYPPGTSPQCNSKSCEEESSSKYGQPWYYSTVGKGCAGGRNDPHFTGGHGESFDFNGAPHKSFCLISDPAFHINMKMTGYYDMRVVGATLLKNGMAVRTWIKELGILWAHPGSGKVHALKMTARGGKSDRRDEGFLESMEVDGTQLPRLKVGDSRQAEGGLSVRFVGYEKQGGGFFDVDAYEVTIDHLTTIEVKLRPAHPLLQTTEDAMTHINVRFLHVAHSESTHGILGQTFREGRHVRALDFTALSTLMRHSLSADGAEGQGLLDGKPQDYETSHVLAPDCRFSVFNSKSSPSS